MTHIGCSAFDLTLNRPFKTKKELREAVAERPGTVILTTTSELGPVRQINAYGVQPGESWSVVGPTPYDRRWYANVKATGNPAMPKVV